MSASEHTRPMLGVSQQIERLKEKGVTFDLCDEERAADILARKNNYLRITSYRKLYERQEEGPNVGDYVNLDFGDLVAISSLDRRLREAYEGNLDRYAQNSSLVSFFDFLLRLVDIWLPCGA